MADKPQTTAEEIMEGLGDALDQIEIFHNQLLIAIHLRQNFKVLPNGEKLYFTDQRTDEDKWQGKVGLVVKKGPIAFKDDQRNTFNGQDVHIGDWVVFRVQEAPAIQVNGLMCRLLEDIHVRGVVTTPEIIW